MKYNLWNIFTIQIKCIYPLNIWRMDDKFRFLFNSYVLQNNKNKYSPFPNFLRLSILNLRLPQLRAQINP